MLTAAMLPSADTIKTTTTTTSPTPTSPTPTPTSPTPTFTKTPTTSMPFTCTVDACTGTGAADLTFRTLQGLINQANKKLAGTSYMGTLMTIAVDGRITAGTLKAYLPISRAVGGKLAIFDFTPDIKYLATNAATFAREIAQWLGITWVEATATVPGHWERLRAGQLAVIPTMISAPAPTQPVAPLPLPTPPPPACLRGGKPTSVGCLYPTGTVQAFDKRRGKWRLALTVEAFKALPPQASPIAVTQVSKPPASGFGFEEFGTVALPPKGQTHIVVGETDAPTPNVPQVDVSTFTAVVGEAPQPPQQGTPPVRIDVGPTTVVEPPPTAAPPDQFPGSQPPPQSQRYKGCIARFNKKRKTFSIYCPINAAPQGFGLANEYFKCLYGNCNGLGADAVTPPVPEGFNPVPVATTSTLPGQGETPAGEEKDKFFRANNPAMWALIAGTAVVVGGGGYWFIRRRKRAA